MPNTTSLPHWDLTPFFPSLDSSEFDRAFAGVTADIPKVIALFDEVTATGADFKTGLERMVDSLEHLYEDYGVLATYIGLLVSVDSRDTAAQARMSELERNAVELTKLQSRLTRWIGDGDVDGALAASDRLKPYAYWLKLEQQEARHLMTQAEEELAADLHLSGGDAWSRLHGDVTSQIAVTVSLSDGDKEMPMSRVRNLAFDPDRDVRRRAYEAELASWEKNRVPIAAAMNSIKGEVVTLSKRRGWESPLARSLFVRHIDRATLDAMIGAARDSFPDMRRYMAAKARAIKVEKLSWFDLFAPLSSDERVWEWDDAEQFIITHFGAYSGKLSDFALRAFSERWIDAEPRSGKRDGAFCAGVRRDESRILANFKPSFGGMSTLAHELGHGYHNLCIADRPVMLRSSPMTLAETASIFCETVIRQAGLAASSEREQIGILEASLQGSCQIIVDIISRFDFEQEVFGGRANREFSPDEFCGLMVAAQKATYGDGLDNDRLHPYMWAMKPHYYSSNSFYNYPYLFGMLFGLGLYARFKDNPVEFRAGYDDLLASTGAADASTLANRFGIDIRAKEFWADSLAIVKGDVDRFEALVGGVV